MLNAKSFKAAFLVFVATSFVIHGMVMSQDLKKGDRIVFLGDSITQAGVGPNGYVTKVKEFLGKRHPGVEVIGAGISGHKVPDLEKRLQKDVIDKKPTIVVIYIGINDVWHSQSGRGTSKGDFKAGLNRIIKKINDADARVILCTPSVIGEKTDGSNPLDNMLEEYSEISRSVAKATGSQLLDLRKMFIDQLQKSNADNNAKNVFTSDGVHLNKAGNEFVAKLMIGGLMGKSGKKLQHVVLFKFKDDADPASVKKIVADFAELKKKIDTIVDFEMGTNISKENLSQGFTHAFVVTFADQAGLDAYLPHDAHQAFVKTLGPVDKVLVIDYWTK